MTSTGISLPPSATPTLVTQQLTFLAPALLTPSVEYQQTPRPESAHPAMADQPPAPVHHDEPSIKITFLLLSGKRKTMGFDPEYTIGKVRQEIFNDWPEEWADETRPPEPTAIRLLHAGRFLEDSELLSNDRKFPPHPAPSTVVHLTVRPFPARTSSTRDRKRATFFRTASAFSNRGSIPNRDASAREHQDGAVAQATADGNHSPEEAPRGGCCIIC